MTNNHIEVEIVKQLKEQSQTVTTAESCTGGNLSAQFTSVSGASEVFNLGVCAYTDARKEKILGVDRENLEEFTAASQQVAVQMAEGVRELGNGSDYGISTTGYAGPGGGTKTEPVGTVYIAVATPAKIYVKRYFFTGNRKQITERATQSALRLFKDVLDGKIDDYVTVYYKVANPDEE